MIIMTIKLKIKNKKIILMKKILLKIPPSHTVVFFKIKVN